MSVDEAQPFATQGTVRSEKLFFGKTDGFTKAYLPVVYTNGESALGIGAYPGLIGDGGTISTII
jgi:hypothetical protein